MDGEGGRCGAVLHGVAVQPVWASVPGSRVGTVRAAPPAASTLASWDARGWPSRVPFLADGEAGLAGQGTGREVQAGGGGDAGVERLQERAAGVVEGGEQGAADGAGREVGVEGAARGGFAA